MAIDCAIYYLVLWEEGMLVNALADVVDGALVVEATMLVVGAAVVAARKNPTIGCMLRSCCLIRVPPLDCH